MHLRPVSRRWRRHVTAALAATGLVGVLVVSAAPAASGGTPVASDGFDQTVKTGWGSAPLGGSWTEVGGSSSSVSSGVAHVVGVKPGRSFYAYLPSVSVADVNVKATFVVPSTRDFYYSVQGRRQSDGSAYRGRARIDKNQHLHIEITRIGSSGEALLAEQTVSSSVQVGGKLSLELGVTKTSPVVAKARVYVAGSTMPDWQLSASDDSGSKITSAGAVGVHAYVGSRSTETSVNTDAFSVSTPQMTSIPSPTPAPPVPPAPTTTPTSSPSPTTPTTASSHGSATVGSTSYAVPTGAIFVSRTGDDTGAGTQASPFATVTKALSRASGGGTIVLRGGTYHEYFVVPPGKNVTIQSYPKEAVWFDGSSRVTGFTGSGGRWKVDNWTTTFDSSPTYTKGKPDGTGEGRQFVNPAYPMAAHPDAVWINGSEQKQVASLGKVVAGTFFVDYSAKRLYLGSDPSGKTVEASTLAQAVSLRAPGTVLRGLGFRRFGDSVWQQGVITSYQPNMTLENLDVVDSATAGIGLYGSGCVLRNVTVRGSGQMGLQASYADGLVADNISVRSSNDENFNPAPSAGGFKVTRTRGFTMTNSEVTGTTGNSVWADESVYDTTLTGNTISKGSRYGIVLELSSKAVVSNNVVSDTAYDGLFVTNTNNVSVWNNTFLAMHRSGIALNQDARRIEQLSVAGHDPRRSQPDMSMPWVTKQISVGNNIITGGPNGRSTLYYVDAWDRALSGDEMVDFSNGNVFSQTAVGTPKHVVSWGRRGTYALDYASLADFARAIGKDKASMSYIGTPTDSSYRAVAAISSKDSTVGQALPAVVATKVGRATGTRHLGVWR